MNFGKLSKDTLNFNNNYKLTKFVLPLLKEYLYENKNTGYLETCNYIIVFFYRVKIF